MSLWTRYHQNRINQATREYLRGLTAPGRPQNAPGFDLSDVYAHSLTSGSTGSGKTRFIALLIQMLLEAGRTGFGLIDPKGELFDLALYLCWKYEVLDRVRIIDFSNSAFCSPYNVFAPWHNCDLDYFCHTRSETLRELMPGRDQISLRAAGLLKKAISLCVATGQNILAMERIFEDAAFCYSLVKKCHDPKLRYYFTKIFPKEPPQTVGSLRGRVSALLSSSSLRQSLGCEHSPDFRRLQDEQTITLINCGGQSISRGIRSLLQGIIISDIRQSVFTRQNHNPFVWFCDEAQELLKTTQSCEDLTEILQMGRSYGTFVSLLAQNFSASVQDRSMRQNIFTNIKWSFLLRSPKEEASYLSGALPVTGRVLSRRLPFQEPQYMTENEERNHLLECVASLPNRSGWLWQRVKSRYAVKVRTAPVEMDPIILSTVLSAIKNSTIGGRIERVETVLPDPVSGMDLFLENVEKDKKNEGRVKRKR